LYEYLRDNPASAKKLVNRWLEEADGRLEGLEKLLGLTEEQRNADDKWQQPSHSGGYENLPILHRSATEAYQYSPDFPVVDFPTDPGLLLDSKVADHLVKGIEKLAVKVDKALPALTKMAFDREVKREFDGMVRMYERAEQEITPELRARLREEATEKVARDNYSSSRIDGLESLDRILGQLPYHARNSWYCPVSQDAIMSRAIDLHVSLLGKVETEGMGRLVMNGALALHGFALQWGDDMNLSDETRAKLPGLARAVIGFEHDPKAVSIAAHSMGKAAIPEALPVLKAGLKDSDPDVRRTSVEAIRNYGQGAVAAIDLMPLLEDETSHWLQAEAAYTLLVVAPEQAEAARITLRSLLKQEGSHRYWVNGRQHSSARRDAQRTSVIDSLGALGDAAIPAAGVLAELLDDPDSDYVRMAASITLLRIGATEYTEAALATIRDLASEGGTIKWVADPESRFGDRAEPQSKEKDDQFRGQVLSELHRAGKNGGPALPLLREFAAAPVRTLPVDISEEAKAAVIAYKTVDYYARSNNVAESLEALEKTLSDSGHSSEVATIRAYVEAHGFEAFQSLAAARLDQIELNQLSKNARDTIRKIERAMAEAE
jgi:hypothetical protein